MKKVLILVLSCDLTPYRKMIDTALKTWDSVDVEGCETVYYLGKSKSISTSKEIHLPIDESLANMGEKTLQAFEWVLNKNEFDYIARVHSSCYVDKKRLMEHIQSLPDEALFSGVEASSQNGFQYCWGGGHYIISRDVIQKIVANRQTWAHHYMEDEAMSLLVSQFGIPFHQGKSCSINKRQSDWLLLAYGGESKEFIDFSELNETDQFFFRVKQDAARDRDEWIMNELYKNLK